MKLKPFTIMILVTCGLIFGCAQNESASTQTETSAKHGNQKAGRQETKVYIKNTAQEAEIRRLTGIAVMTGNIDEVKRHIDSGKYLIQSTDEDGASLLHYAAMAADFHGTLEVAKYLIIEGLDCNIADKKGQTPLHYALMRNRNRENKVREIRWIDSYHKLHAKMAELLIELGAEVNAQNYKGFTALHVAATSGNEAAINLLIEKGADANIANNVGFVPLHTAVLQKHNHIVPILMRHTDVKYINQIEVTEKEYQGTVEELMNEFSFTNAAQEAEIRPLLDRISRAGIAKFNIASLESGTLRDVVGERLTEKKILVWNSAGRRLYPSVAAAQADGFVVWEFYPDSKAANLLKKQLKNDGGYNDDFLLIFWDGLDFNVNNWR